MLALHVHTANCSRMKRNYDNIYNKFFPEYLSNLGLVFHISYSGHLGEKRDNNDKTLSLLSLVTFFIKLYIYFSNCEIKVNLRLKKLIFFTHDFMPFVSLSLIFTRN